MSNLGNNILDGHELLNQDYEVTFSTYWQKVERFFSPIYVALMAASFVLFVWIAYGEFYSDIDIIAEIILSILGLATIPVTFIIFIQQFRKFRARDFNEKIKKGRIWKLLTVGGVLILLIGLITAIAILVLLFLIYSLLVGSPDPEGVMSLIIYALISTFMGFQTLYLGYSILYLIENNRLKKQYV